MQPFSDKTETGKKELTVEELKALRLCSCGNWKSPRHSVCGHCFLLFADSDEQASFAADVQKVRTGEMKVSDLFHYVENMPASRKQCILDLMLRLRIKLGPEDFHFIKLHKEKGDTKRLFFKGERQQVQRILKQAVPVYRGFNTVT
jgi:hypothetical protein